MCHYKNDERSFAADRFRPKFFFNPRNKDVIIEKYLSCLEERLLDIEIPSKRFNNLTKEEREGLHSLKDDLSIIIKGADKGSVVVFWDRQDYLKVTQRQLDDKEVHEQVPNDPSVLANTLMKALEKIRLRGIFRRPLLTIFQLKILNLQDFICYLKFTNDYMMYQEDQWFRIAVIIPKTYPHFQIITCNHQLRK